MGPALADDLCNLILRAVEIVHQRKIAACLLDRIEIGALHIFDDGIFERLRIICFHHCDWYVMQAGTLRCAPSSLTGDNFEIITLQRAYDNRLNDSSFAD